MKKVLSFLMCAILALSLAACGGVLVDLDTPKSAELKGQYDFYEKSVTNIRTGMSLTPEQSDEVFIALVSVGADTEIYSSGKVAGKDSTYSVNWSGSVGSREVDITDGVVTEIRNGVDVLYPLERSTALINAQAVETVTGLIEGLTADSSRADYEAAQSAYDALSETLLHNLKKEIPKNLVEKLSEYNLFTMTLESAVEAAIEEAGAKKDKVVSANGIVSIYLKGSDNLTNNMIRDGMLIEANNILEYLQPRSDISRIALFWTLPLVDTFGNTAEDTVMKIQLEKDTLDKINFDDFDWNKYPDIADDYFEHAALSK